MANLNVILTSDKCEFTNYFKEPVILPVNCEIALVKASITLPVYQQQILTVPEIPAGERALQFCVTYIDGIELDHTWTALWNAFNSFTGGLDQGLGTTVNDFFGGEYQFWLNNPLRAEDTGVGTHPKITFQEVFAKMVDDAYKFYDILPKSNWVASSADILNQDNQSLANGPWQPFLGAAGYDRIISYPVTCTHWGIASQYTLGAYAAADEINLPHVAADLVGWNPVTSTWTSAGGGTFNTYDNIGIPNAAYVDPNGGYLTFKMSTLAQNKVAIGLKILAGQGNRRSNQDNVLPASVGNLLMIDVGIEFTQQGAGNVLRFIDGQRNATPPQVNLVPAGEPYLGFNAADTFYIQMNRVSSLAGEDKFSYKVTIFRSDNVAPNLQTNAVKLYESRLSLPSPAMGVNPVLLSDGIGNVVTECRYIPINLQSQDQGERVAANAQIGNIQIRRTNANQNATNTIREDIDEFYRIIGLQEYQEEMDRFIIDNSNLSTDNNLRIDWQVPYSIDDQDTVKIIGENRLDSMINIQSNFTEVAPADSALRSLLTINDFPKQLEVRINDIPIKNISGSAPASLKQLATVAIEYDTTTLDRIIGTIPCDESKIKLDNFDWNLDYEPFTPVFRPLNNPNPINLTQLQCEVTYRDFNPGIAGGVASSSNKRIPYIPGICQFELQVRTGRKPVAVDNGLRPY